eukprot:1839003-Prymnesium_polylepis.1
MAASALCFEEPSALVEEHVRRSRRALELDLRRLPVHVGGRDEQPAAGVRRGRVCLTRDVHRGLRVRDHADDRP